jgi:hypothetical protein
MLENVILKSDLKCESCDCLIKFVDDKRADAGVEKCVNAKQQKDICRICNASIYISLNASIGISKFL